jgi:hypothetical protein
VTPHYYMYYIVIEFFVVIYPLALVAMLMRPILREFLKPIEKRLRKLKKRLKELLVNNRLNYFPSP